AHALRLLGAPALEEGENNVLPRHPGLQAPADHHAPLASQREIDIARRPAEAERGRAHADADRAVRTIGATVRIGAGIEASGNDEPLLREIEVEDAGSGRRV